LLDDDILVKVLAVTCSRTMDLDFQVVFLGWTWWRRRRRWRGRLTCRLNAVINVAMVVDDLLNNRWPNDRLRWWWWRRRRRGWFSWWLWSRGPFSSANDDFLTFDLTGRRRWTGRALTTYDPLFLLFAN
jgi:hypothetical protein